MCSLPLGPALRNAFCTANKDYAELYMYRGTAAGVYVGGTVMVMMMAKKPSLNASSLPLFMLRPLDTNERRTLRQWRSPVRWGGSGLHQAGCSCQRPIRLPAGSLIVATQRLPSVRMGLTTTPPFAPASFAASWMPST